MQNLRQITLVLLVAALAMPVVICVLVGLARLLAAMGDTAGAAGVNWIALAAGVVWVVGLIGLVIVQAIASLDRDRDDFDDGEK
jgi:hypothetical protein